jgi:hypothetical protein
LRSKDVPETLWPRQTPGNSTVASKFFSGLDFLAAPSEVDADEWFDHRDAHNYVVMEDSVRISSTSVLSLLWWRDEKQLVDLEGDEE